MPKFMLQLTELQLMVIVELLQFLGGMIMVPQIIQQMIRNLELILLEIVTNNFYRRLCFKIYQ